MTSTKAADVTELLLVVKQMPGNTSSLWQCLCLTIALTLILRGLDYR